MIFNEHKDKQFGLPVANIEPHPKISCRQSDASMVAADVSPVFQE